jgi:hypothetical protein
VHLDYTPEQQRLRTELRSCFAALVPENGYARHSDPAAQKQFYRDTIRRHRHRRAARRGLARGVRRPGPQSWPSSSSSTRPPRPQGESEFGAQ